MVMDVLPQRLKECREKMKYRQIDVATYSDITEAAYQNYERGRREPKLSILMRIAQTFHVSVDYLVGLTDEPKPYPPPKNSQES
ncbi:MAG: helix-turn-helix transcriptional regulator [Oscillospiraceae bacterium]|jgi:transcriptional regulator with XRE-family HTH domain|nr:helix-turn-helix transcriptional regulator [Oscillospiraceae bacterium]